METGAIPAFRRDECWRATASRRAVPRNRARTRCSQLVVGAIAPILLVAGCGQAPTGAGPVSPAASSLSEAHSAPDPASDTPSRILTSTGPGPSGCTPGLPKSLSGLREPGTGPASSLLSVAVSPSGSAQGIGSVRTGEILDVATELMVRADGPRIVLRSTSSALLVLQDDQVVAGRLGDGATPVPLPLTAGRRSSAQTVPQNLPMVDCDGQPLEPGRYQLRAVVGYGEDPLNAGQGQSAPGGFVLVSPAVTLNVTR